MNNYPNLKKNFMTAFKGSKFKIYNNSILFYAITLLFVTSAVSAQKVNIPVSKEEKYLYVVQRSVDSLLMNARDIYGKEHSGMILSILDCRNAKPLTREDLYFDQYREFNFQTVMYADREVFLPWPPLGVRSGDRTGLGGSNANLQEDLYRAMGHLSQITGEEKYKNAAHDALKDFLRITQSPVTGLLACGEHLSWNCFEDRLGNDVDPNNTYEPTRKFVFFDYLYSVDPVRTLKYAQGLWDHQIADKNTGDFSRHTKYHIHSPGQGWDFPKAGSYFIDTWSRAYEKTKDSEFSRAVRTLATRYLNRTNELGLLDLDTSGKPERVDRCVTLFLLSLAIESNGAIKRMDRETAIILDKLIESQDKGFLSLPHEIENPEKGFVGNAYTSTGDPRPTPNKQSAGYSRLWGMGYGSHTTSMFGLLAYTRLQQIKTGEKAEAYHKMILQAAKVYQSNPPDLLNDDIWAGEYGMAILLEIAAYRLTNDHSFLATAQDLADDAIKVFWKDGEYAVPRASSLTQYYDCITFPDTLILALLAVYEHTNGNQPLVEISDLNRG